jgi:hypothetical protein
VVRIRETGLVGCIRHGRDHSESNDYQEEEAGTAHFDWYKYVNSLLHGLESLAGVDVG